MAFLAIPVPTEVGRLIRELEVPGIKETPFEYHITLLIFGDNFPIPKMMKAVEATYELVSKIEPFSVKTNKVSHFPPREDKPVPIIAPVQSEELMSLHKKLKKEFDSRHINFNKTFKEYRPHITLAYSEEGHDDYKIDPALEFTVNQVVLYGGDEGDSKLFTTFQLKAPERKKHALLQNRVEVFEKIAGSLLK